MGNEITIREVNELTAQPSRQTLINSFIDSLDVKKNSKDLYRRTLGIYLDWVEGKGYNLRDVARPQVLQYKDELLQAGKSSLTVGSYITVVRKFYEWVEANKYHYNVAKGIKSPHRKQQFRKQALQPSQATELIDYYKESSKRDYAIINLLLRTGLRTIEVIRANVGNITFKGGKRVLLVQGKGRDDLDNFVILTDKTYGPILEYLKTRNNVKNTDPLFISVSNFNYGGRLTTRTISKVAKEGLKGIGLDEKEFTAHSLRHTTAVNILRAGGSIETAQYTLRHTNPATTQIYTATIKEEQRLNNSGEVLIDSLY
jgi:integrase/recombinase XerD